MYLIQKFNLIKVTTLLKNLQISIKLQIIRAFSPTPSCCLRLILKNSGRNAFLSRCQNISEEDRGSSSPASFIRNTISTDEAKAKAAQKTFILAKLILCKVMRRLACPPSIGGPQSRDGPRRYLSSRYAPHHPVPARGEFRVTTMTGSTDSLCKKASVY